MICLHCGHCCIHYAVMIISNPERGLVEDNIEFHEGNGTPCKHLIGNYPGEYKCAIHEEEWYKETPCYEFDQIGNVNSVCRIGKYIMNKGEIKMKKYYIAVRFSVLGRSGEYTDADARIDSLDEAKRLCRVMSNILSMSDEAKNEMSKIFSGISSNFNWNKYNKTEVILKEWDADENDTIDWRS